MFDFQKEVVLNSLDSVKKFENGFRVDGMLYKNEYVGPVYKTEAVDGAKAKLVIDLDKVKGSADAKNIENVMQFVIELGLDNDYRGDFGSVLFYFRKPIVVTMDVNSDVDTVAKAFEKAGVVDYKLYNVYTAKSENKPEGVNPTGNQIVLVMADNYITVRKAEVMDLVCDGACGEVGQVSKLAYTFDLKDSSVYTKNNVGFGTYDYMIHNLRLPTYANIRFASPAESEMPVKGGKYTQYSFEYTVPRRLGGLSVAGQKTESTTIHTFFVLSTEAANFEKFLDKVTIKSVTKNENGKVSFDHTPDTEMHENLANGVVSGKAQDVVIEDNE
jgi:hypothetical protein